MLRKSLLLLWLVLAWQSCSCVLNMGNTMSRTGSGFAFGVVAIPVIVIGLLVLGAFWEKISRKQ